MEENNVEIKRCNCGGQVKLHLTSRSDYGSAVIQCCSCAISINENTNSLGYDDSLDSLKHRALYKWNRTFKDNEVQTITWNGFNCYE